MQWVRTQLRPWPLTRILIGVMLSILLGWLVARGINWPELGSLIYQFPAGQLLFALGVFLVGIVLRAWRFYVLFVSERVGFIRLFLIQNAGIGLNNVSPVRVLSEPVQLMLLTRRSGISGGIALATLATEHLMDITVTASLLILGVVLMPELRGFSIQLTGAVVLGIVSLLVFFVIVRGIEALPGTKRIPILGTALASVRTLRHSPIRLFLSFLGTLGHWTALGGSGWIIARGLDIDVGVAVVVVLFLGSVFFVSAVPSLPGGAITFEAAVVYSLSLFDVENEPALAFALLMHIIMFAPSTLIAALVLPREGIKVFRRTEPISIEDGEPHV